MGPKPVSLQIRSNEVNARARRLLRRLNAEASVRQQFRHHAAKGYLALSEMCAALEKLSPGDRKQLLPEIRTMEARLLKLSQGSRFSAR